MGLPPGTWAYSYDPMAGSMFDQGWVGWETDTQPEFGVVDTDIASLRIHHNSEQNPPGVAGNIYQIVPSASVQYLAWRGRWDVDTALPDEGYLVSAYGTLFSGGKQATLVHGDYDDDGPATDGLRPEGDSLGALMAEASSYLQHTHEIILVDGVVTYRLNGEVIGTEPAEDVGAGYALLSFNTLLLNSFATPFDQNQDYLLEWIVAGAVPALGAGRKWWLGVAGWGGAGAPLETGTFYIEGPGNSHFGGLDTPIIWDETTQSGGSPFILYDDDISLTYIQVLQDVTILDGYAYVDWAGSTAGVGLDLLFLDSSFGVIDQASVSGVSGTGPAQVTGPFGVTIPAGGFIRLVMSGPSDLSIYGEMSLDWQQG